MYVCVYIYIYVYIYIKHTYIIYIRYTHRMAPSAGGLLSGSHHYEADALAAADGVP